MPKECVCEHPFVQYAKVTLLEISPCQCPTVKRSGSCSYALLYLPTFMRAGVRGSSPGKIFSFKVALPPKIWFSGSQVWNKTKGTVTLKHCAVHKQFITHSYWEVIRWTKRISFSYSTVPTEWDIGSDSPRNSVFTPTYFQAEAVRKSSRQLQVLPGKNYLLFVVETYHTFTFSSFVFSLSNSQAQPMSTVQRPPKSTTEKVPGPDVTRVRPSSSTGRTAEVTLIQSGRRPLFNH